MNDGLLSVRNASGRHVSLLNFAEEDSRRKYRCCEPGCNKSFTTSGHLARHNRIHTGEKNFPCLFPGCHSRFSRQDNMMQHYRTHMSPKSRRSSKRSTPPLDEPRPKPRLHAHQRIRSDPIGIEPPLTIDQHLFNYHESLRVIPPRLHIQPPPKSSQLTSPTLSPASQQQLLHPLHKQDAPCFYRHFPLTFSTYPHQPQHVPLTLLHPSKPLLPPPPRSPSPKRWAQDPVPFEPIIPQEQEQNTSTASAKTDSL
ncbi:hypothetical protein BY458DRAFT_466311, partial [Sporodiniella umbellata]